MVRVGAGWSEGWRGVWVCGWVAGVGWWVFGWGFGREVSEPAPQYPPTKLIQVGASCIKSCICMAPLVLTVRPAAFCIGSKCACGFALAST